MTAGKSDIIFESQAAGREKKEREMEACLLAEGAAFKEPFRKFLPTLMLTAHWPVPSHLTQMQLLAGSILV